MASGILTSPDIRREGIARQLRLTRWFRAFVRSECQHANHPESWGHTLTREQAQRELIRRIHVAINRKAGAPDVSGRKQTPEYQIGLLRDSQKIRDYFRHRVSVRLCNLDTTEMRKRFEGRIPRDYSDW